MVKFAAALSIYVVLGVYLTRRMCPLNFKLHFGDLAVSPLGMPIVTTLSVLCTGLRTVWKAILIAVDFHPEDWEPKTKEQEWEK